RVADVVLVDHLFRIDADVGERREHGLEPAGLRRRAAARRFIAAPQDGDAAEAGCGGRNGKRLRVHLRAPARASAGREQDLDGNRLCEAGSLRCPDACYIDAIRRPGKVRPLSAFHTLSRIARLAAAIAFSSRLYIVQPLMRFARTSPAPDRMRMCSLRVGAVTPSFSAISTPHTPSATRSPSTCGGKWAHGSLSHPGIRMRRSFARALRTTVVSIFIIC